MSHPTTHAAHDDANAPRTYMMILGALLVLTVITVLASRIQFGSGMVNVIVAMAIATVKASLVGLFFMHLRHDKPVNAIILVSSFIFLGLFLISCYTDMATRDAITPSNLKVAPPASAAPATPPTATPATPPTAAH